MINEQYNIGEIVREMERSYVSGTTTISKYVEFNQYENINKIEAYVNSKHISGDTDSMGREKPFFNIVTAATNIWYRATDIDRRNIRIKATRKDQYVSAFIATILLQEWMKREAFGTFLNDWGRNLAKYGSVVLKFVEQDGKLKPSVVPWSRMICDTVDFDNNVKIEKIYLTPSQLKQHKGYDKEMVRLLLDALEARENLDGHKKDGKADYIELYEVHGELPLSYLTGKETDEDEYRQQMHVVSFVASKQKGEFDDFTLISGKEAKDPYMITHLIKEDGRTQSIGAVEYLFEAQWMENHTVKSIKDQLDLASQLIFQTSDASFVGRNVLQSVMTGDILVHEANQSLTQINNNSHDITSLQSYGQQWKTLAQELTSTPDSMMGNTAPSGTAWRQVEALQGEAHSLFEIMTENKGLHIEEMMRKYIIPHLKKKMDSTEEVAATLDAQGIAEFDAMYVPNEAIRLENQRIIDTVLSGELAENQDLAMIEAGIKKGLQAQGNQRFIKPSDLNNKTWKEVLKDLEWEVEVEVTGESVDKDAKVTTLTTVLQTIATNPLVLHDKTMRMLLGKILEETGALSAIDLPAPEAPAAPVDPAQAAQMPTPQPQSAIIK